MKSLMKAVVVCAAMCGFAAVAFADENVNLTADVREKQAAGVCGAPSITGAGHASYPYAKAFDGISDSATGNRWLSAADNNPASAWAQYVAPEDYAPGVAFALTRYRVHRLFNSGGFDLARSPKKWEILGVLPDGSTEVVATQSYTWGSENTDDVRIQTFEITTDYKYRGFQFHPLETSSGDSVRFGLLEVEFIVSWVYADDDVLSVSATFMDLTTGFSPALGATVKEATTCTAPSEVWHDSLPHALAGYTLETWEDGAWTGGDVTNAANTYAYSPETTKGVRRLTWCYVPVSYNLVPTLRAAGIEPTIKGPSAGLDWPVANVFDGVTHTDSPASAAALKLRWLCKKGDGPYVQVSVSADYHGSFAIRPVAYRLWRLYSDNLGFERSPTAWTLTGIRAEDGEEVTIDSVSGVSWERGATDDVRMKMFTLEDAPEGDFRSFVFAPTATQEQDDYTGLFELEIFVREVSKAANSLSIASAGDRALDCSPAVGEDQTEPCTCTRTSKGYSETLRSLPAGYKLYRQEGPTWTEIASDPTADTYEWDGTGGTLKLEWQWGEVDGYKVDVTSYGEETFAFAPALDARGFIDIGTQVSVTPVVQTDPASRFKEWVGDVPAGSETTVPLVLTVDVPKAIRGEFTRVWKFIPETDAAKAGVFTDGNWSFRAEKDTLAPIGDYEPDLALPAGSYRAGQGLLDMSTLQADTGRRLTVIRANSVTNRIGLTGLILPPGLARIGAPAFAGSPDLTFVEMPDSVLQCESGNAGGGTGGAFGGCTALTRVNLSNGLVSLGHQTFGGCSKLATVTPFLPKSLTYLGSAFQNCTALAGTPDLSGVETFENGCFMNCSGIVGDLDLTGKTLLAGAGGNGPFMGTGITSAHGVGMLATRIFYQCTALTNVSCVAGVTEIVERSFAGCAALKSVSAPDDFAKVTKIGYGCFSTCTAGLVIPQKWPSVQVIDASAFWSAALDPKLRLEFPNVETLGISCFEYAVVTSIDFRGSSFSTVPDTAFRMTSPGIGNLILPETVTTLKPNAFNNWKGRHDLRFCGLPPSTIEGNAFAECDEYRELYIHVPREPEKLAAWKVDANFVALADIPDVETKPGWDAIKGNTHLIGTWRNKWCFTWNASPKKGLILLFQ